MACDNVQVLPILEYANSTSMHNKCCIAILGGTVAEYYSKGTQFVVLCSVLMSRKCI